jgi:hypothetical protein
MGKRRAVGATIASVLLFGSLVASNFLLVAGAQEKEQLFSLADQENALSAQAFALQSATLLEVLDRLQLGVSSAAIPCSQSVAFLSTLAGNPTKPVSAGDDYANATVMLAQDVTDPDNLTTLAQYAGSVSGHLNVLATVSVRGAASGGAVSYSKTEAHYLNLPLDLDRVISFCLEASSRIKNGILVLGSSICNATAVESLMNGFKDEYAVAAAGIGFGFSISYSHSNSASCTVLFSIRVSQQNVDGPLGCFDWAVEQTESVSQ